MLTKDDVLPDDVWAQLDPHAGRLSWRGVLAVWGAGLAAFVLIMAIGGLLNAGILAPHLRIGGFDVAYDYRRQIASRTHPISITFSFDLINKGAVAVDVRSVTVRNAGTLVGSTGLPAVVGGLGRHHVTVTYLVSACGHDPVMVPYAQVKQWWGTEHVYLGLETGTGFDCSDGS